MKNKENNPFDIILSVTPDFSEEEAINIAKQHYNLVVSAENLVSERDQNFLLRTNKQKKYVLKIANSEEDPIVTDFQICALMHINNTNDDRISVPEIKFTNKNKNSVTLSKENKTVEIRLYYDERGLDRYYGLLELGELGGLWKNVAGRYEIDGKKVYAKAILKDPEAYFTPEVMEKLDVIAREEFSYGS